MQQKLIINRLYSVVCHLSSAPLHLSRTLYKSPLFMQNKPNFLRSQMNVNIYNTMDYENKSGWTLGQNKPNSNPILSAVGGLQMSMIQRDTEKTSLSQSNKTNPIQTQFKPNQSQSQKSQNECNLTYNKGLQK